MHPSTFPQEFGDVAVSILCWDWWPIHTLQALDVCHMYSKAAWASKTSFSVAVTRWGTDERYGRMSWMMDEEGRRERPWLCTRAHGPHPSELQPRLQQRHDPLIRTLSLRPRLIDSHFLDVQLLWLQTSLGKTPKTLWEKWGRSAVFNGLMENINTKTRDIRAGYYRTPTSWESDYSKQTAATLLISKELWWNLQWWTSGRKGACR